ncbi:Six-hairpin glycosidase-like protein [Plectosphaerella plurivora]|uniref:Six-hairpin glycosidase-like protein n=1 Tax=Plectosphaerella plurivora TaxID=936078 RepID=A0A9P8VK28_9PEZI|nr:Six-hairpin glycosidase-like protein [Plectosphaerella plurivora]
MKLSTLSFTASLLHVAQALSASPDDDAILYATDGPVTLSSDGQTPGILILDFGQSYEGHPTFEVLSTMGDTSRFEVTFAESSAALNLYMSDGPLPLAAAMETHRVKRFNISTPSVQEGRLIQGAFRYQKLNLSTAGQLVLQNVGVRQTIHTTPLTELPGAFECSDEDLTRIWHAGARTAQLTEIPKNTIPDFWVVSKEGSLVESLAAQPFTGGAGLLNYHISVEVKPVTGSFILAVLQDTLANGIDIVCDFNTGKVEAIFERAVIASADLASSPPLDSWLSITAMVAMSEIQVSISNVTVLSFSQDKRVFGSFGLGAPFAHSAYFRNLVATDPSGGPIYSSTLTDRAFLDDFLMGDNPADTIVDGSRRDRIAYNGDLDIALAATFASTYGLSFAQGSLDLMASFQLAPGFFVPTAKIQQGPLSDIIQANATGLIGYSFNLVTALAQSYMVTGDVALAEKWAPAVTRMLDWAHFQIRDGVFTLDDASLTGDWNYYDPSQTGASSKFNAVYAYSLQQSLVFLQAGGVQTETYEARLASLRRDMHTRLFDASLGAYVLTSEIRGGFAQDAQAIAVLAGVPQANNVSATSILTTMQRELLLPAGPLAFSNSTAASGFAQKISPYASSYHLRAAFEAGDAAGAMELMKRLWAPMANPAHVNYTNSFWETLDPDGTPGLGIITSLCHGWAAGPTAELSRYVLGVRPAKPGFAEWEVKPMSLGLEYAKGKQHTERGDITVSWAFDDAGLVRMNVTGPEGGLVYLPEPLVIPLNESTIFVNGDGETVIVQKNSGAGCGKRDGGKSVRK